MISRFIYDKKYWYNYLDIDILLKDKCNNQYFICDSTSLDLKHFNKTIEFACKKLKDGDKHIMSVVIPINIGFIDNEIYKGLHWAGIVIKRHPKNQFEALYADSVNNSFNNDLLNIITNNGIDVFKNCSSKQQHNLYDCGPWTVFNLDSLARTGELPFTIDDKAIHEQRLTLKRLSETKKDEIELINICDSSIENIIKKSSDSEEFYKNQDLNKLENILEALFRYENNECDIRKTLIIIGEMFGELSYNDNMDKENRRIRNRYGYIQRNKNKSINKYGIYFEKLYHLKIIMENLSDDEIHKIEIDVLRSSLLNLKSKIAYIFHEEGQNSSVDMKNIKLNIRIDFSLSISDLIDFSNKYHQQMVLKEISTQLQELPIIDLSTKDDRYYFARVFCIIGELISELIEDWDLQITSPMVMEILKQFVVLRNQIVHFHERIKLGLIDNNEYMRDIVVIIKNHMNKLIIKEEINEQKWRINHDYEDVQWFKEDLNNLLNCFSRNQSKFDEENKSIKKEKRKSKKIKSKEEIEKSLHHLVSKACDFIEEKVPKIADSREKNIKSKSIEEQLFILDKQYQCLLNKIDELNRGQFPTSLHLSNENFIKQTSRRFPPKSLILKENLEETKKQINTTMEKLQAKVQLIKEETQYLILVSNDEMYERKYQYIRQHIMMVFGQLMRDIENLNICQKMATNTNEYWKNEYLNEISPYFNKFSSSLLLNEGRFSSKTSRNHGLAHNIWSFNAKQFYEGLKNVISASVQLESFADILQKDQLPITVNSLNNIAVSFTEIGLYNEAIDYLEKAIERLQQYPDEAVVINPDNFTDEFEYILTMKKPVYQLYRNLASNLIMAEHFEKAHKVLMFLKSKIDIDKLKMCKNDQFKTEISGIYRDINFYFQTKNQYKEAIETLNEAESIMEDCITQSYLAKIYYETQQFDLAEKLCDNVVRNDPDDVGKFFALELLISIFLQQSDQRNRINDINKCIDHMQMLAVKKLGSFKSFFRDKYLVIKLVIIERHLNAIIERNYQNLNENLEPKLELSELIDIEIEFQNNMETLKGELKGHRVVTDIYLDFCITFCCIFNETNFQLDNEGKYLKKAQNYFDLACNVIDDIANNDLSFKSSPAKAAVPLSKAYNNYAMLNTSLDVKERIECLLKALNIQDKYNIRNIVTMNNLGFQFINLGNKYFKMFQLNGNEELSELALTNFDESIKYYKLNISKQLDINSETYQADIDAINEGKKSLAYCYHGRSILKYNLKLLKETFDYFQTTLNCDSNNNLTTEERKDLVQYQIIIETLMNNVIEVLKQILNSSPYCKEVKNVREYTIKYCHNRFNIDIIYEYGNWIWHYKGQLSYLELRIKLKMDLSCLNEEEFLLYEFYKILLTKTIVNGDNN